MSRTFIIWALVILILIGGGFSFWKFGMTPATSGSAENQPAAAAATNPQVQGQDVTVGTGKTAEPGTSVSVLYVGMLQDGTVFDSSAANGNAPLIFTLGTDGLIPGFQIGVNGMKEGGERRIAIPPELGYGNQDVKDPSGKVIIPANSTIVFDVRLVKVEEAGASQSQ